MVNKHLGTLRRDDFPPTGYKKCKRSSGYAKSPIRRSFTFRVMRERTWKRCQICNELDILALKGFYNLC
ncbi:hypothetical protein C8R42DRAFT_330238 [Lentinula raphanica]|nr:hypothetical protein C8R42DRAFT_330238 [Lentinula raphanica]